MSGAVPVPVTADVRALLLARLETVRGLEADIPSPCVSVCRMDDARELCLGCARTIDEIRVWSRSDDAARKAIWRRIEARLAPPEAGA